jgi:hypothetical protein
LYTSDQDYDYAIRVKQLSDGGYLLLTRYYNGITSGKRIHLHRLDQNGELIWQCAYGDYDSLLFGEDGYDLNIINDNKYLITAYCYYPDSGQQGGWIRPYLLKTESNGILIWETIWGKDNYYYGKTYNSVIDNYGNIYSIGLHVENMLQSPSLIKTSPDGQETWYSDLVDTAGFGQGQTITFMEDSNLYIALGWRGNDEIWHNGFMKTDTLGTPLEFRK